MDAVIVWIPALCKCVVLYLLKIFWVMLLDNLSGVEGGIMILDSAEGKTNYVCGFALFSGRLSIVYCINLPRFLTKVFMWSKEAPTLKYVRTSQITLSSGEQLEPSFLYMKPQMIRMYFFFFAHVGRDMKHPKEATVLQVVSDGEVWDEGIYREWPHCLSLSLNHGHYLLFCLLNNCIFLKLWILH